MTERKWGTRGKEPISPPREASSLTLLKGEEVFFSTRKGAPNEGVLLPKKTAPRGKALAVRGKEKK